MKRDDIVICERNKPQNTKANFTKKNFHEVSVELLARLAMAYGHLLPHFLSNSNETKMKKKSPLHLQQYFRLSFEKIASLAIFLNSPLATLSTASTPRIQ